MACGLLLGFGDGAFEPAFTVAFAEILPGDALLAANSLQSIMLRLSAVAGAGLGGALLVLVGSAGALAFDGATFAVSVACIIGAGRWTAVRAPAERLLRSVMTGIRHVAAQRWIPMSIASFGLSVALVISPSKVLVPLLVRDRLHADQSAYGLLLAAQGAGDLVVARGVGSGGGLPGGRDGRLGGVAATARSLRAPRPRVER